MKRFIVIVLDGYGIGAMDDVPYLRPADTGANTCLHIFRSVPDLRLPTLEGLGLANAMLLSENIQLPPQIALSDTACYSFNNLAHFGADTYWGHQELLGSKPLKPERATFKTYLPQIKKALESAGHTVRLYPEFNSLYSSNETPAVLIVDGGMIVGDNLETDPGNNFNVTAALDIVPFEKVRKVGSIVRENVSVSRVIVFGGTGVSLQNILNAYETKQDLYAGVSAPKSGVYRQGYQVVHMGFGINSAGQVPAKLAAIDIPSVLIGKVADIAENPGGKRIPGIDTEEVLVVTIQELQKMKQGFICTNVQETDLAGHRTDADLFAKRLTAADRCIGDIIKLMQKDDMLIITADHGNDPTIGHAQHTREKTPLLIYGKKAVGGSIKERQSLSDTGASAADFFGAKPTEAGVSYMAEIFRIK